MRCVTILIALLSLTAVASEQPAPPGKLVDVGGYRIHLHCTGKGNQTVVLSPGGGGFSFDWHWVQQKAGAFARVCSYDRAGSAWSEPGPEPRTMRQEAHEVFTALQRAGERGPYILVGQSLGGLAMRIFARRYPEATAGVVLVDATSPDSTLSLNGKLVRLRELAKDRPVPEVQTKVSGPPAASSGPPAARARKIGPPQDKLPVEIQKLYLWAWSLPPRGSQADNFMAEEFNELYQHSQATPQPLGNRPLISIVAMRADPPPSGVDKEQWDNLVREKIAQKRDYRNLSTNSKVVEDAQSGHHVHLDNPGTVVTAIRDVVEAVRRRIPLAP